MGENMAIDAKDLFIMDKLQEELGILQKRYEQEGLPSALFCGILIQGATKVAFQSAGTRAQAEHTLREYMRVSLHMERENV